MAGTDFESIDPDLEIAKIETPYDAEILQKYRRLEETKVYAPGSAGSSYSSQAEGYLDEKVAIDRAVVQSRQSSSEDLVSAYGKGKLELQNMPSASLPVALQGKSPQEQSRLLRARQAEREALKQEISNLNSARQQHIRKKASQLPTYDSPSFGQSFRRSRK